MTLFASIQQTTAILNASKNKFLDLAIAEAREAERNGDVPVGAVVVFQGEVISTAHNEREQLQDPTAHAEVLAIRRASLVLGSWRLNDCELIVTLEPCAMCAAALINARIGSVYFGTSDPKAGACGSVFSLHQSDQLNHCFEAHNLNNLECSTMLKDFFKRRR